MAKNRLKTLYKLTSFFVVLVVIFNLVYFSYSIDNKDSFIVKRPKRQSVSSLKQRVIDNLVSLLQESSKIIELNSQVQQKLQNNILDYIGNNKDSYLVKNKDIKELSQILEYLDKANIQSKIQKEELIKLKNYLDFKKPTVCK